VQGFAGPHVLAVKQSPNTSIAIFSVEATILYAQTHLTVLANAEQNLKQASLFLTPFRPPIFLADAQTV